MEKNPSTLSSLIKKQALSLGFDLCGIASSEILDENAARLAEWCSAGMNDRMNYLGRDIGKRSNPGRHLPGAKSLVITGLNYFTTRVQKHVGVPVISKYALSKDYHDIILPKLNELLAYTRCLVPTAGGRAFCDSAPLFEKPWAVRAGLGWQGKHSLVINPEIGSFFFIGVLILDIELEPDKPYTTDGCGNCRTCIESCPTEAINENRTIDARKCISNLTIENRDPLSQEAATKFKRRIYGCDICQDVCPWNKKAAPHEHPELMIKEEVASMTPEDWKSLSKERFIELFSGTPVGWVNFRKFRSNIVSTFESMKYKAGKS